jgi:hypothetical protein
MISMNFYGAKNASPNTMCVLPKQVCIYKKTVIVFYDMGTTWCIKYFLVVFAQNMCL